MSSRCFNNSTSAWPWSQFNFFFHFCSCMCMSVFECAHVLTWKTPVQSWVSYSSELKTQVSEGLSSAAGYIDTLERPSPFRLTEIQNFSNYDYRGRVRKCWEPADFLCWTLPQCLEQLTSTFQDAAQLSPNQPQWAVSDGSAFTPLEPQLVWLACPSWNVVCKRQDKDCCLLNTCPSRWRLWASSPPPHSHTCSWAATVCPWVKAIISAA